MLALELIASGRQAVAGHDVRDMIEADLAFHHAVYTGSGNPLLAQTASVHWHHIRRAMGAVLLRSSLRGTVWDEHEAIATAIAEGRAPDAERLMCAHTSNAAANMARWLPWSPAARP